MLLSPVVFSVAIAQRGKGEKCTKILAECGVMVQYIGLAHGTASSEIMDFLGLDEPEKDIVLGLSLGSCTKEAFSRLGEEMGFEGRGTGIAFSIPVSSMNGAMADTIGLPEKYERSFLEMTERFEMIVAAVESGMTEIVMDSARAAGARGGTVMKCRDMSPENARKVFGITIHQDKEMLMLVTKQKDKERIMKAICSTIQEETENQAVVFSIAIDDVVGLHS